MTKTVKVEVLDKSCETCPMFEMGEETVFVSCLDEKYDKPYRAYTCSHQDFCLAVLTSWEKHHKEETV